MFLGIIFGFPSAGLLLLVVSLIIYMFLSLQKYRKEIFTKFFAAHTDDLGIPRSVKNFWIKTTLLCLAWIFAAVALMNPMGSLEYPKGLNPKNLSSKRSEKIFFVIDHSQSMGVKDSKQKSRMDSVKNAMEEIVRRLSGHPIALFTFSSDVEQLAPLTFDSYFIRMMTDQISNQGGTDLVTVFDELNKRIGEFSGEKIMIIASDGGDTLWETLYGDEKQERQKKIIHSLKQLRGQRTTFVFLSVGTIKGGLVQGVTYQGRTVTSHLQEELIQEMAKSVDGIVLDITQKDPLALAEAIQVVLGGIEKKSDAMPIEQQYLINPLYFQYPLFFALVFLLLFFFIPNVEKKIHIKSVS